MIWIEAVLIDKGINTESDNNDNFAIVWENENGPRPLPPFIAIAFTGSGTPGMPYYSKVEIENAEDDGEQIISRHVRRTLTMYCFGRSAYDVLETIKASIDKNTYIDMLAEKYLAIPRFEDVQENPNIVSNEIESGAQFSFDITYQRNVIDKPGWIEHAIIEPDGINMETIER